MRNIRHKIKSIFFILIVAVALFSFTGTTYAKAASDFTGTWNCDDGGSYYLRQIGNALWWYGESDTVAPVFSNVAHGSIKGNKINVQWADVPKGSILGKGKLTLEIVSDNELKAVSKTGGFSGSVWTRA